MLTTAIIMAVGLLCDPFMLDHLFQTPRRKVQVSLASSEEFVKDDLRLMSSTEASTPVSSPPKPALEFHLDFDFVPKDFSCNDLFYETNYAFNYTASYNERLDSFQSATIFAGITSESIANEQTWMLHEIAKNGAIRTICETGFKAGHNAFHWLTAQEENIVYSFEEENRYNYTKEMAMFMMSEFPDRFYAFYGDTKSTIKTFAAEYNATRCDMIYLDSTHDAETLQQNMQNFAHIANRRNVVILDTHPRDAVNKYAVDLWESAKKAGLIHESFRCHYLKHQNDIGLRIHQQNGLLIGSYQVRR